MDPSTMPEIPEIPLWVSIVAMVIGAVINGIVLMYAAGMLGIFDATFEKCFISALLVSITTSLIFYLMGADETTGPPVLISLPISALVNTIFIKYILNTDWGRAFLAYLLSIIIVVVVFVVLVCFCCGMGGCITGPALMG